jgi:hypothetical protein
LIPRSPGRSRRSCRPSASRRRGHRSSRSGFPRGSSACTPRWPFGCTEWSRGYVDAHADELVQVVPEVVIIDELHQLLNAAAVVLKPRLALVEFLNDVADLPAGIACVQGEVRWFSAAFSLRRFLLSFFLSLRLSSQVSPLLNSRHSSPSSQSSMFYKLSGF